MNYCWIDNQWPRPNSVITAASEVVTIVLFAGYYIYAEASHPRKRGDRAHLKSPRLTGVHCLQFFFHMHGAHMGRLNIFLLVGATRSLVESHQGDQGKPWYSAKGTIGAAQPYQVSTMSCDKKSASLSCSRVLPPKAHWDIALEYEARVCWHQAVCYDEGVKTQFNPLRPSIKLQILLLCFHTFITYVKGRSCSNINRISFEWSCSQFSWPH